MLPEYSCDAVRNGRRPSLPKSVLDSYALLAFLFQEKGHEKVSALLEKAVETDQLLLMSVDTWAEVRYMVERKVGPARWAETRQKVLALPLEVIPADHTMAEISLLKISLML